MAWTTPITWAANQQLTSALFNQQLRDNQNWLLNGKGMTFKSYRPGTNYSITIASSWNYLDNTNLMITTPVITSGRMKATITFNSVISNPGANASCYFDIIMNGTYYGSSQTGGALTAGSSYGLGMVGNGAAYGIASPASSSIKITAIYTNLPFSNFTIGLVYFYTVSGGGGSTCFVEGVYNPITITTEEL